MCEERLGPLDEGGPIHYFILEAVCMAIFTSEFLLRLASSPATIGLRKFLTAIPNWIDVFAIAPFYIDLIILQVASGSIKFLAVLRIIRLSRIVRVLKFSKSISGVMVLGRTVYKSFSAMVLIVCVSLFM